ncbi:tyrosine-type recombinase/integrase [Clostridium cylindrosporum]|uniref:Phage integrase family n=1 Tax=Clostridium cylindrosporum DSM 605 TaxID=1121307 RepID=A0A0J8DAC5_CLOCY|nr:tyrosine-type recombinase/integrase [Clostridium cylindrosporum]KMT22995.1 phage integrase family [Clostridium cylindrosporum DSM 605]
MKADPILDVERITDISDYLKVRNKRDYVLFSIGIYTGLRIQDILELRVRDVKTDNGKIKAYINKKDTNMDVEVNDELKMILKDYIKDKKDYEYLFKSRQGANKHISRQRAYDILSRAGKEFGIRISPHSLRKTFARILFVMSNQDITIPMQALGHTTPEQTRKYIGVTEAVVNSYIQKINLKGNNRKSKCI